MSVKSKLLVAGVGAGVGVLVIVLVSRAQAAPAPAPALAPAPPSPLPNPNPKATSKTGKTTSARSGTVHVDIQPVQPESSTVNNALAWLGNLLKKAGGVAQAHPETLPQLQPPTQQPQGTQKPGVLDTIATWWSDLGKPQTTWTQQSQGK